MYVNRQIFTAEDIAKIYERRRDNNRLGFAYQLAFVRLASYSGKNHFYRANRELGRIFKTEHILQFMSDPLMRQRIRRGLLKGEEIHALARQVAYGKQGSITSQDLQGQKNTASCLTLIMACIIYWQAKEINRVILEDDPDGSTGIFQFP